VEGRVKKSSIAYLLLLSLAFSAKGYAQTIALPPVADTYLRSGGPNQNQGTDTFLRVQQSGSNRSLVRFDSAAIASAVGSGSLASARLELYIQANGNNWGSDGRTVDAHRLTTNWSELGATWNCGIDSNPANSSADCNPQWAGGQFADEPSDTVLHTNGLAGWISFDVTADVRSFLSGTANYGWVVKKSDEGQSGQADYTSREGTADHAPRLVLTVESASFDQVPPSIAITDPTRSVLVNEPSPTITVTYADGGSGIDPASFQLLIDAQDATASCTAGATSATCRPPALPAGNHTLLAKVRDHAGNPAQASFSFQLLLGPGPHLVTFQAIGDTYLRKGAPNQNQGTEPILRIQKSGVNRTLVQFDPQSLSTTLAGATLVSASLELHIQENGGNWGSQGRTVDVNRMTAAWTEGGATWNCPNDANPTNQQPDCATQWAGGIFAASPTASVLHTNNLTGWVSFDVTSDVAAFLTGTPSYGWLVKKTNEGQSGRMDYDSRQGTAGEGPRLVVVFTTATGADTTPPTITITAPADGSFVTSATPTITASYSDTGSGINPASVRLEIDGVDRTAEAQVTASGLTFTPSTALAEGVHTVTVLVQDQAGNSATAAATMTLDTTPPTLTLDSPTPGQMTNQATVRVAGTADDENGIASVQVNGTPVAVSGDRFETSISVAEGVSQVLVHAVDTAGNGKDITVEVRRFSLPVVAITSPADLSYLAATTTDVEGTVSGAVTAVDVNGVSAQVSGTTFVARAVPLLEGGNILTAAARDTNGHVGTASINVVRDLTPPRIAIDNPVDGARLLDSTITVSGLVNDIVDGTVNSSEATVTVNGLPATVANRSFTVDVPLTPGDNVLTATAVDRSGNTGQASVTVHLDPPGAPRIAIVSGDHQQAVIRTLLPNPLTAVLLDAAGQPMPGKPVLFAVRGNDGSLDGGKRQIAVLTGENGQASAQFTLGTRVGTGNQVVEATAVGFHGPALFQASALSGNPTLIVVDSGNQQYGIAGQALPRPLIAVVTDAGYNRLPGIPVRFKVVKGDGHFMDGSQELVIASDSDGRAIVPWVLGPEEGIANNVAEARIDALPDGPLAGFVANGRVAGDPLLTTVSGVVLDNSNQPVPGVTVRILDTAFTAQTDAQGMFHIAGAPVGTVKLIVDGSTSQRPGSWPDLEFVLTTIPGRDNTLGMPIYLLPLNLTGGLQVDETHGGTLTLPDVPGFALEVLPGSVTFPGGGKSGVVSVTVVHNDKVPMVPNFGQQPLLIVTIQPAGARFEPPARLTVPNVEGFAPGQVAEMYSFDHDLGHFVSIGPGTVSEDGTVITSNHGVGIVKAGWHCCGYPQGSGAPNSCPDCAPCTGDKCKPKELCGFCPETGKACDGDGKCLSGKDLLPKICPRLTITSTQAPSFVCKKCGAAIIKHFETVDPHCQFVSLSGTSLHEEVTPVLQECTTQQAVVGGEEGCPIVGTTPKGPNNSECTDDIKLCGDPEAFPLGTCRQIYRQIIKVGDCVVETHEIEFTITRTATSCSGTAAAN
jgi:uncharacterized Zn-binding protein involved in type VI secretion